MNKLSQEEIKVNMELYNRYRSVPENAQKTITGGRLNGMTDINPMWRLKCLTETFGACGKGWYTEVKNVDVDRFIVDRTEEAIVSMEVVLYVKYGDEWSKPISGIGGSKLVAKERNGYYVDDDAYKKAYTDAIGICCKQLGMGADIWWNADTTKYDIPPADPNKTDPEELYFRCEECGKIIKGGKYQGKELGARAWAEKTKELTGKVLCPSHMKVYADG